MWVLFSPILFLAVAAIVSYLWSRASRGLNWAGLRVVITGGSDGLGLATAKLAAGRGAHVIILARNAARLERAKTEIESVRRNGSSQVVQAIACDVTDESSLKQVFAGLGAVDLLIANAGMAVPKLFVDQTDSEMHQMMNVNFFGAANAARCVIPAMQKARKGRVVFVASSMSLTAFAGFAGYCASKWALRGFAECLQSELAPKGVSVQIYYATTMKTPGLVSENLVKPAVTHELESLGDAQEPDDAARVLLHGIDANRFEICGDAGGEILAMAALTSPYANTPLRWLLAPLLVPLAATWRWYTRRVAHKHLKF